jgi:hypothetical protein
MQDHLFEDLADIIAAYSTDARSQGVIAATWIATDGTQRRLA